MGEEFEIEIQAENEAETKNIQLPLNFITVGEIDHDDVKVYIKQNIYKSMEKLALSDTTKELGSIMLGNYVENMGKMNVVISEYIEAKYTDASASTLTFTHETWDYVHKQQDLLYPSLKIIGWQHTHPNYGIFLSNYDMFIQDNFFNLPFQVAYVIDPIQYIRGFFQWKNGKVEKLKGFYIYDEIGKPIKIEQTKPQNIESHTSKLVGTKWTIALLCLLVLSITAFAATTVSLNSRLKLQQDSQNELQAQIKEQDSKISSQDSAVKDLQQTFIYSIKNSANASELQSLIDKIENHQITLYNQDKLLTELNMLLSKLENDGDNSLIYLEPYTVKDGDNLSKICLDNEIDYSSNVNIIKVISGIEDLNMIHVGQTILLPVLLDN